MYRVRRQKVLEKMMDQSIAIIYSSNPVLRDFFYLTGIERSNMALVLVKFNEQMQELLFIPKPDPFYEKWNGKLMTIEEAREVSQINSIHYIEDLDSTVLRFIDRSPIAHLYFDLQECHLEPNQEMNTRNAILYRDYFPSLAIKNIHDIIGVLRMSKDKNEIEAIKHAIEMTNQGLEDVMSCLKPGLYEYQVQAIYEYRIKYLGSIKPSFNTIAGAGYNGTMLHYGTNRDLCRDGDLILLDLGSMSEGYCSDITRTYPINGKFTDRQKQIYNIVLKANETISKVAKQGMTLMELNDICKEVLANGLLEIGLIRDKSEISRYYMHGVSHHLGLDVHDVTISSCPQLMPGAVISNEPGIYIEEEAIGIRIEDDLLITEDGCVVLSQNIIRTVEDIEEFMASNTMEL